MLELADASSRGSRFRASPISATARSRTETPLLARAPEARVSANSTTVAYGLSIIVEHVSIEPSRYRDNRLTLGRLEISILSLARGATTDF